MEQNFTTETPIEEIAETASTCEQTRKELTQALGHESRATREHASQALLALARTDLSLLQDSTDDIIDALNRPEALTRYSMIEIIGDLSQDEPKLILDAYESLQDCLYDEDSGTVRLYSFRALARYGATGPSRSLKVWPDLAMVLRCFHGDAEFMAMMSELIQMLGGRSDQKVKEAAVELFAFDAENARGELRRKAETIASFAPEILERINKENEEKVKAATAAKEAQKAAAEAEDDEEE